MCNTPRALSGSEAGLSALLELPIGEPERHTYWSFCKTSWVVLGPESWVHSASCQPWPFLTLIESYTSLWLGGSVPIPPTPGPSPTKWTVGLPQTTLHTQGAHFTKHSIVSLGLQNDPVKKQYKVCYTHLMARKTHTDRWMNRVEKSSSKRLLIER